MRSSRRAAGQAGCVAHAYTFFRALGHQRWRPPRHRVPARVDHVVVHDADLARNVADKRGDLGLVVASGGPCA